jgi:hypothetical protein
MKITYYLTMLLLFAFVLGSCEKDNLKPDATVKQSDNQKSDDGSALKSVDASVPELCGSKTYTLWLNDPVDAGNVTVGNDATNLYVTFYTPGLFGKIAFWAGTDSTLYPTDVPGTAPKPAVFPYQVDLTLTGLNTHTFVIPLANIPFYKKCGDKLYFLAHAWMKYNDQSGQAWGGDLSFYAKDVLIHYGKYQTGCCETPPPPPTEQLGTAFAKGGWVFTTDSKSNPESLPSLKLTKNRWGWAINLKQAGSTTYDVWVGAGLNYTSKGKKVGTVTIDFNGSQATITYNYLPGYGMEEAHIYAGDGKPTTLAPGQYGNTFYFSPFASTFTTTLDVADTNGDGVWFILHSVAYGPGVSNP